MPPNLLCGGRCLTDRMPGRAGHGSTKLDAILRAPHRAPLPCGPRRYNRVGGGISPKTDLLTTTTTGSMAAMSLGREVRYRVLGGRQLSGTVFVQGAKNAVLPMIGASLLA